MEPVVSRIRSVNVTDRQAITLFVVTSIMFALLIAAMLSVTTSTARSNRELDRLNAADKEKQNEVTELWTTIGQETSADRMAARAKKMGFAPTDKVEHLVISATITAAQHITPTR